MNKFYITTPIYYVNGKPSIGHTYTTVAADALARFHRLKKEDVYFVTGTDENSQKNIQAMEATGESDPEVYLARMAAEWKQTWRDLDISIDDFIRTSEPRHLAGVERFWNAVKETGDIYEGEYEGLYCVGCEAFKATSDLVEDRCPLHPKKELKTLKEKNYFFRLTKYREELLKLYEAGNDFVMPESRRHEIRNYVADHLSDISISREKKSVGIGIPVPGDDSQVIYVWFDALINYLTAIGYGTDETKFEHLWPADLHLVGKEIIKFHCALWPAMLMSAAKNDPLLREENGSAKLPKQVFAHGFFTIDGQKISKSLGNAIDPRALVPTYGFDAIRYYLLREIPFGEDGDFSHTRLQERYTADLANTLGNLLNRAVAMSRKYFDGKVPDPFVTQAALPEVSGEWSGKEGLDALAVAVGKAYEHTRVDHALELIWSGADRAHGAGLSQANKYIEDTQPFKLVKENPEAVGRILYALLEACRWYAWLLHPVMPQASKQIFFQIGLNEEKELSERWDEALVWGKLKAGTPLPEPRPLFPRLNEEST